MKRTKVLGDVLAVAIEGEEETADDVVKRNVVIAGDADLRAGKFDHEVAGGGILAAAAALGEVAGVDDDVGFGGEDVGDDGLRDCGLVAAEVNVGDVGESLHARERLQGKRVG